MADLLDSAWDPIGLYDDDDRPPPGEYECYAWQVLSHLRDGDSEAEIAALRVGIKARMMELGPGPEDAEAARLLVEWFQGIDV